MAKRREDRAEIELAFRLKRPENLSNLLEIIWPASGIINLDGVTLARVSEDIQLSVHLFSADTDSAFKKRVKLFVAKGRLIAKLEQKHHQGNVKYERTLRKTKNKEKIVETLKEVQPVISAFCKERATLIYRSLSIKKGANVEQYVTIGVDRIAAVPTYLGDHAPCFGFYDVDIEGDGSGIERAFARSNFFRTQLGTLLIPLDRSTSKWRAARAASRRRPLKLLECKSYDDAVRIYAHFINGFNQVFPEVFKLVGPRQRAKGHKV